MAITLYQDRGDYPSLHIMVTDNPRYQAGKLCLKDKQEVLKRVEQWLNRNTTEVTV